MEHAWTEMAAPVTIVESLVARARQGDRAAHADLHRRYGRLVHAILLARVPYGECEDLVQDVFLAAFEKLGGLHDDRAFGAWIGTIARNRAKDWHRTRRDTEPYDDGALGRAPPPVLEALEVLRAVRTLPDAYQETLILRLVEGMTGPEIAEQTGLTPDSVRVNLSRGMKMLRAALGEEGP